MVESSDKIDAMAVQDFVIEEEELEKFTGLQRNYCLKRAQQGSLQGALEFKTEIELLSLINHKNVVELVSFCYDQGEQMLVHEYIANGTLNENLTGQGIKNMEKPKDTSKQEKQKMVIGIGGGGGGVGGVLVWGAAVAIATLVSVSVLKLRNKRLPNKANHHPPPPPQPQPMPSTTDASNNLEVNTNIGGDDQGKGLIVLLQDNSSPPPDYHPSGDGIKDVSLDSTPLDSNKSLILDIDAMLDITRQKEKHHYLDILLGDNPKPKNSSLETCDYGDKQQEYSLAAEEKVLQSDQFEEHSQIPFGKGGEEEEQENGGEIVKEVTETFQIDPSSIELNLEGFEVRAPDAPQIEEEDNRKKMQLLGEQAEEEEEQDDIVETVKEVTEINQKDQFAVELNMEEIQVMKQDEVIGAAPDSPQSETEDHPQMHLVEEEQENGENILEMVVEVVKTAQKDQFAVEIHPESIQVMEEEEAIDSPRIEAEDNPETQLIGEGKEHDHGEREEEDSDEVDEDEEETAEKGEESSEGTGDSSMESNAEAIWPAESIEELSLQLTEESITNIQKLEENNIECRAVVTDDSGCYASIKNQGIYANGNYKNEDTGKSRISSMKDLLMRINVSTDTSNMGIWISSAAVLLLIVMAPLLLSFANIVKLCVIVFLLVILSHNWELP